MSAEAGRWASRQWDGLRPERLVPEGNECSALSTLSKSEEVVARAAARRVAARSSLGKDLGGAAGGQRPRHRWAGRADPARARRKRDAARRPRGSAWRRERLQRIRESISRQIEIRGLAGFSRGPGNGCQPVSSDIVEPIETSTPHFVVLAKGMGDARTNARRVSRSVQDARPCGHQCQREASPGQETGIRGKGEAEENQATDPVERRCVLSDRNEGSHQRRRAHLGSPPLGSKTDTGAERTSLPNGRTLSCGTCLAPRRDAVCDPALLILLRCVWLRPFVK